MKRLATACLALAFAMAGPLATSVQAQDGPLNQDGSFEDHEVGAWTGLNAWFLQVDGGAAATWSVVDNPVQDGNRALRVQIQTMGSDNWHIQAVNQSINIFATGPGVYEYSGYVRAGQSGGSVLVGIDLDAPASYEWIEDGTILEENLTQEWRHVNFTFTVPEVIEQTGETPEVIRAFHSFNQEGNTAGQVFFLDNVRITFVGETSTEGGADHRQLALHQNYPNPFTSSTVVSYELTNPEHVTLSVYNLLGQRVATLVDGIQVSGRHEARFEANGLAAGMYMYRLQAGDRVEMKQMLLVK